MKKCNVLLLLFIMFIVPSLVFAEETKTGIGYLNNSTVIISNNMGADVQLTRQTTNQNQLDIKTIIFQSSYNFRKNVVYEYEVELNNNYITNNINKFSLLGHNMTCSLISIQGLNTSYMQIRFTCPNDTTYVQISLSNLSNNNITTGYQIGWNSIYLWSITDQLDLGPIINNDTQNTQNIINNNNQNTQDIINSNQVCYNVDKYNVEKSGYFLNENGEEVSNGGYGITNYFKINSTSKINVVFNRSDSASICFYNVNKSLISCTKDNQFSLGQQVTIPSNSDYVRATINLGDNKPTYQICSNGNQAVSDSVTSLDNTIKDDDVDTSNASDFFNNFTDNQHGLSGIISAPLVAINQMLNNQCSPLTATYQSQTLSLPCGYSMWSRFSTFKQFLNIALDGLLCYQILLKLFKLVEKIKNPEDDRIEVMNL